MRFSPVQKNQGQLVVAVIFLLVLSVAGFSIPSALSIEGVTVPPIIFYGLGLIFSIAAIYIFLRYGMTKLEYVIKKRDDGYGGEVMQRAFGEDVPLDFVVYKAMGTRRASMECVLSLSDFVEAVPLRKGERTKKDVLSAYKNDGFSYYDYTLTFLAKESVELIFADGEKFVGIIIESGNSVAEFFLGK